MKQTENLTEVNRRDFLRGGSFATLMAVLGGVPLQGADKPATGYSADKKQGDPVTCAVIGCGNWGREIMRALSVMPGAAVTAICDTYEPFLRRSKEAAPKADPITDYKQILADKKIKAVLVATPSHLHKQIVLEALQAGKHVYCEAPLATTIEDARAIATAAKAAVKLHFQSGLILRSDPQRKFLLDFIRAGALGRPALARSQWHKKESWRRASPNPDRERDLNWRVTAQTSPGLAGELSIHQFDSANWTLNMRPIAVTGFGSIVQWNDGRDVADTVQAVLEYPNGVRLLHDCTLANSFDSDYEMFHGTEAAVMIRGNKAWMFKETDAPLLGWEVYARKDAFYQETGIALAANATKLTAHADKATDEAPYTQTTLSAALEAFINNVDLHQTAVEDFASTFNIADINALREYLVSINKTKLPHATSQDGYEATITALTANQAIVKGQRIEFKKDWFEV